MSVAFESDMPKRQEAEKVLQKMKASRGGDSGLQTLDEESVDAMDVDISGMKDDLVPVRVTWDTSDVFLFNNSKHVMSGGE